MKKLKILGITLSGIALIYAIITISGCYKEGPMGPAGADGTDGTPGVDGNVTCLACHSTTAKTLKDLEFVRSQHASGSIAVAYAGGRASCSYCHSHEGYVEYAATGDVDQDFPAPSAWKCSTCHSLHSTFDSTDYAFRLGTAVTLIADGVTVLDKGNNNVCINCHQSRKNDDSYDNLTVATVDTIDFDVVKDVADISYYTAAYTAGTLPGAIDTFTVGGDFYIVFDIPTTNVFISSTHAGPHHGPQTNTWQGVGGITASAGTPYGSHSGGCVGCHMGTASGHSFIPEEDNCVGCHASKET